MKWDILYKEIKWVLKWKGFSNGYFQDDRINHRDLVTKNYATTYEQYEVDEFLNSLGPVLKDSLIKEKL